MAASFDVVREVLGVDAGPDLVADVEALSLGEVDALAGAILDDPMGDLSARPVTQIWPLIPLRSSVFFDQLNHESASADFPSEKIPVPRARRSVAEESQIPAAAFEQGVQEMRAGT